MPGKRKLGDLNPQPAVHESRRTQVYGDRPKPAKKAKKIDFENRKPTSAVNDLKKHIRDLRRKLARVQDLPADVRAEDERALAAYEQELVSAEQKKVRDACIKRWHMVRFFERQKATRLVKKYKKQLLAAETEDDVQKWKSRLHVAEVDLNYAQYSPLAEPYVSIFPAKRKKDSEDEEDDPEDVDSEAQDDSRPPVWKEVETAMEEGMLNKLRNRAPALPPKPVKPMSKPATETKVPNKHARTIVKAAPEVDTTGLNRRERRKLLRGEETAPRTRTKIKSMSAGFEKNMAFGAEQALADKKKSYYQPQEVEDDSDDGGFFE